MVQMKPRTVQFFFPLCFLLVACCPVHAQNHLERSQKSCRSSVQGFYDWYVAKRVGENVDWHVALEQKGQAFSTELTLSLRNSDVESKVDGDPVLDFDPILNTQDMGDQYTVRSVTIDHDRCWADVYGVWSRPVPNNGQTLNVVAELVSKKGRWVFVNFHYPSSGNYPSVDLLQILGVHYKDPQKEKK
jgi:hypothetical protein